MDSNAPEESISVVKNTTNEHSKHSAIKPLAQAAHAGVAKDMSGSAIGPVPIKEWLKFLPDHKKAPITARRGFFTKVLDPDHEVDVYQPFVSRLLLSDTRH